MIESKYRNLGEISDSEYRLVVLSSLQALMKAQAETFKILGDILESTEQASSAIKLGDVMMKSAKALYEFLYEVNDDKD